MKTIQAATVSMLLSWSLILYGPARIYASNFDEFSFGALELVAPLLSIALIAATVGFGILLLLQGQWRSRIGVMFFAISLALYVQGNYLLWNYGELNGESIQWQHFFWLGVVDIAAWLGIGLAAWFFTNRLQKHLLIWCAALFFIQLGTIVVELRQVELRQAHGLKGSGEARNSSDSMVRFSSGVNVIHILLDAYQTTTFNEVLRMHPEYEDALQGFTFFEENTGVLSRTALSVPAMWTAKIYKNQEPLQWFMREELPNKSLPDLLAKRGYRSDVATLSRYCRYLSESRCTSLAYLGTDLATIKRSEILRLMDLTLFRFLPNTLKKAVYNDQKWFLQSVYGRDLSGVGGQRDSIRVVNKLLDQGYVKGDEGTYKFIHLMMPHGPYLVNARCRPAKTQKSLPGKIPAAYRESAECAMIQTTRFLDKLRQLGIYDDSLILLTADHGFNPNLDYDTAQSIFNQGRSIAMPIMLVKLPGADHALQRVDNPTSLIDIPRTVTDSLNISGGFGGQNAFDSSFPRLRHYYHHGRRSKSQTTHLAPMQEFLINGPVNEETSWQIGQRYDPSH